MLKHYKLRNYNFKLLIMVIALAVIGIIAVGSAEEALQSKQIAGFAAGVCLMIFLSLFDYSVILNFYWMIYILNVILLALVIFMGDEDMLFIFNFYLLHNRKKNNKEKRIERGLEQLARNLRFVRYYPHEVLLSPIWKCWHYGWRKKHGYL